ncbi:choice-of-anchor L domain-containing protein [Mesobacillus foraminis]|uniref:choice-of-anchor L domain-containing protein n=1 Tax=Mesobacillus foraminis TaxID=279826 RepID=UPI0039A290E5
MKKNLIKLGALTLSLCVLIPSFALAADGERGGESKKGIEQKSTSQFSLFSSGLATNDLTSGLTPEQLVKNLLGGGVTVQNVKFKGAFHAAGSFSGGDGIIGFNDGIILSSGSISNVIGPNQSDSIADFNGSGGDADLQSLIPGYSVNDATTLEFDFIPENDVISFQYVFASDKYNEYVNSSFNDVFGFFVNGKNMALIPGTSTPVSINNVNGIANSEYFINNDLSDTDATINIEMDGLTKVLFVKAPVKKGEVNHIKMAIGDAGDTSHDSNVFIKAKSFIDQPVNTPPLLSSTNQELTVNEGETASNSGKWSDENPDDNVTLSSSLGTVTKAGENEDGSWEWSYVAKDDLNEYVTVTANDGTDEEETKFNLIVKNVDPIINKLSGSTDSVMMGSEAKLTAKFTDPGVLDTHTAVWDWGDGTTSNGAVTEANGSGSAAGKHLYTKPGVYNVTVTVTDKDN